MLSVPEIVSSAVRHRYVPSSITLSAVLIKIC